MNYSTLVANLLLLADEEYGETQTKIILEAASMLENLGKQVEKSNQQFEEFVYEWTGKDMEYHNNAHTTGLSFAWACWNRALTFDCFKYAGLRNGKIVEFAKDKLALNHDHIDEIVEIELK